MADELMNPRGVYCHEEKSLAPRLSNLSNKVLGLVDNTKKNADLFLDYVQKILSKSYVFSDILYLKKSIASVPAPLTPEFLERCNLAINAVGD